MSSSLLKLGKASGTLGVETAHILLDELLTTGTAFLRVLLLSLLLLLLLLLLLFLLLLIRNS